MKSFTDKDVIRADYSTVVNESFKTASPLLDYITDVLNTNLNGESLL